jgi:hypothetical protein
MNTCVFYPSCLSHSLTYILLRQLCVTPLDPNYCGSLPKRNYYNPVQSTIWTRCGKTELDARSFCGEPCTWHCSGEGESCQPVHANYCDSEYYRL